MKNILKIVFIISPLLINAQNTNYNLNSYLSEGIKAPNTHHIGEAWLNFLVEANDDFDKNITQTSFSPNSTLDWHKHATAQIIIVLEGKGYYQERDNNPIIIKKVMLLPV